MYVPDEVVTNDDLAERMETSDEWIQARTGIRERRFAPEGVSCSDLAVPAAQAAIADAGLQNKDIDMILFGTLSPDHHFPGTGCFMQAKMGLVGTPVMDIRNQCTGFVYGMGVAKAFVEAGHYRNVLVVGSEVHSSALNLTTAGRDVGVLFGDGAGAAVISAAGDDEGGAIHSYHQADALYLRIWDISKKPYIQHDGEIGKVDPAMLWPEMNGRVVFKYAVRGMIGAIGEACAANGITPADIDLVVPHQANMRINEYVAKTLGIPPEKVVHSIEQYGNTTAATIPMGMCVARDEGRLERGMKVMAVAFGAGFTWGSVYFDY